MVVIYLDFITYIFNLYRPMLIFREKQPHLFIPGKTAALVPEFAVEDLPLAELQPWFLRLQ